MDLGIIANPGTPDDNIVDLMAAKTCSHKIDIPITQSELTVEGFVS